MIQLLNFEGQLPGHTYKGMFQISMGLLLTCMSREKVAELQPSRKRTRTRKEKEEEKDKEEKDEECTLRKTQDLNQWVRNRIVIS